MGGTAAHLWRRNAVLSILGGTAIHVALATASPPTDSAQPGPRPGRSATVAGAQPAAARQPGWAPSRPERSLRVTL